MNLGEDYETFDTNKAVNQIPSAKNQLKLTGDLLNRMVRNARSKQNNVIDFTFVTVTWRVFFFREMVINVPFGFVL